MFVAIKDICFAIIMHKALLFIWTYTSSGGLSGNSVLAMVSVSHPSSNSINKVSEVMVVSSNFDSLFVNYKVTLTVVLLCGSLKSLLSLFLFVENNLVGYNVLRTNFIFLRHIKNVFQHFPMYT